MEPHIRYQSSLLPPCHITAYLQEFICFVFVKNQRVLFVKNICGILLFRENGFFKLLPFTSWYYLKENNQCPIRQRADTEDSSERQRSGKPNYSRKYAAGNNNLSYGFGNPKPAYIFLVEIDIYPEENSLAYQRSYCGSDVREYGNENKIKQNIEYAKYNHDCEVKLLLFYGVQCCSKRPDDEDEHQRNKQDLEGKGRFHKGATVYQRDKHIAEQNSPCCNRRRGNKEIDQ